MSCYNWASGTIKIPNKEWSTFRKFMISRHNTWNSTAYDIAVKLYNTIKEDSKYKRNYDFYYKVFDAVYNGNLTVPRHFKESIYDSLLIKNYPTFKLKRPKKKDFPKATLKTTDYGYFTLNHNNKTLNYNVPEGNRAVDHAARDSYVIKVFAQLRRLNWTRNSGGTIVGNDEYNRKSEIQDGGANYIVHRFGPIKERAFFAAYHH